jgi:hypothetical protein
LLLQAVSSRAEGMLTVDEPAAVDVPLEEFPVCGTVQGQLELASLVERAVAVSTLATPVPLSTLGDPGIEVVPRAAGCGPPPATHQILAPPRTPRTLRRDRMQIRAAVADGSLAG